MGQRSFLHLPMCNYETNNCLGLGWFFLFKTNDLKMFYDRGFHPEGDEWIWPEGEEEGEERCELAYLTVVEKALANFEARAANIKSQYLKDYLASSLDHLRTNLARCKPTDEIYLTCIEFTGLWENDMECADFIKKLPENIDKALANPNYLEFFELLQKTMPEVKMSGNYSEDMAEYSKEKIDMVDVILGGFWDHEKSNTEKTGLS